jgi:hypothetical protein
MICADFQADANLENGNPEILLQSILRLFKFLPVPEKQTFLQQIVTQPSRQGSPKSGTSKTADRCLRGTSTAGAQEGQLALPELSLSEEPSSPP